MRLTLRLLKLSVLLASIFFSPVGVTAELETVIFGGGCFWCMEPPYEKLPGVKEVISGYSGGEKTSPTYEQVSSGGTGHREVVRVKYDPAIVSYEKLLDIFWHNVDPTDDGGQFIDRGEQYRTVIYYRTESQKLAAESSKSVFEKKNTFGKKIATEISPEKPFYPAEEYHQDYYKKNPVRYKYYRFRSGRDDYLKKIWGTSDH